VSSFDAGILRAERSAEGFRASAAGKLAGAFDGVREAVAALGEAVSRSSEESEDALAGAGAAAGEFADALDAAGGAARGAGGAARAAAQGTAAAVEEVTTAAEEAVTGWQAVTEALAEYAEKAREIGGDIGQALVGAFGSAENAVADFVKSGSASATSSPRPSPTSRGSVPGGRWSLPRPLPRRSSPSRPPFSPRRSR
jgi:methyl-accepting chemotaxis protein